MQEPGAPLWGFCANCSLAGTVTPPVETMFALIQRINRNGIAIPLVEQKVVQSLAIAHRD